MIKKLRGSVLSAAVLAGSGLIGGCMAADEAPGDYESLGETQQAISTTFPYCSGANRAACAYGDPGFNFSDSDLSGAWSAWKQNQITNLHGCSVPSGEARVMQFGWVTQLNSNGWHTSSEGMSYGMILTSIFGDKATFDNLYKFVRRTSNGNGLMNWQVNCSGNVSGSGSASDATEDMAYALLLACKKGWTTATYNYCSEASTMIARMKAHEITAGKEVKPGDSWPNDGQQRWNGSYFAPAFHKIFGQHTNDATFWNDVNTRNYAILSAADNDSTGLIPNWNNYSGAAMQPGADSDNGNWARWGWDAPRIAWRLALEKKWFNTTPQTLTRQGNFFNSRMNDIRQVYELNGSTSGAADNGFFTSMAGVAVSTATSNKQGSYDRVKLVKEADGSDYAYFNNYHRLIAMLVMTHNMPNPFDLGGSPPPPPPPSGSCSLTNNATYGIKAVHSNRFMDVYNFGMTDGTNIVQWGTDSNGTQRQFVAVDQGNGYWAFRSVLSGRYMDISGGNASTNNGDNVHLWGTTAGQANRQFKIEAGVHGGCTMKPKNTIDAGLTKCVDVAGVSTSDGANIHQWACAGSANQEWVFQLK